MACARPIVLARLTMTLVLAGCGARVAPALFTGKGTRNDAKIALDPGVCIAAAVHDSSLAIFEVCGPQVVSVPSGENDLLVQWRERPGDTYQAGPAFELEVLAAADANYRLSADRWRRRENERCEVDPFYDPSVPLEISVPSVIVLHDGRGGVLKEVPESSPDEVAARWRRTTSRRLCLLPGLPNN